MIGGAEGFFAFSLRCFLRIGHQTKWSEAAGSRISSRGKRKCWISVFSDFRAQHALHQWFNFDTLMTETEKKKEGGILDRIKTAVTNTKRKFEHVCFLLSSSCRCVLNFFAFEFLLLFAFYLPSVYLLMLVCLAVFGCCRSTMSIRMQNLQVCFLIPFDGQLR
jgi:hypothetical protein